MKKTNKIIIKIGLFLLSFLMIFSLVDASSRPMQNPGTLSSCAGCAEELGSNFDYSFNLEKLNHSTADSVIAVAVFAFVLMMMGVFQPKSWKLLTTIFLVWGVTVAIFSSLPSNLDLYQVILVTILSLTLAWIIIAIYWQYGREKFEDFEHLYHFNGLVQNRIFWSDAEWYLWFKITYGEEYDFISFLEEVEKVV